MSQRIKKKRIAVGVLMANSARKVTELVYVLYNPNNHQVVRRIQHPESILS